MGGEINITDISALSERRFEQEHPTTLHAEPEFQPFSKIPRLRRDCIVTEKIDGTNAQIWISDDSSKIKAGSRSHWITPGKKTDNFGFAGWVEDNKEELVKLGPGRHFGEWWGVGIQRGYGLIERRFSLFNVTPWKDGIPTTLVRLVPTLYTGPFDLRMIDQTVTDLRRTGSQAAPGFMKPEGIVVFHAASGHLFKQTLENDEKPKGSNEG